MTDIPPLEILMAEDDEGHATLVRRNLKRAGVPSEPVHLRDGQELLDYLHRRAPWTERPAHETMVILLDLKMPRLSGTDVLQALRDDDALARVPVFVLTTTDSSGEIDNCYALGASACIVKPVDFGAFSESIQRLGRFLMTIHAPGETPAAQLPTHG